MQNKQLENAILIIKNYCESRDCNDCEMERTCEAIDSTSFPCAWEIKE